MSFRWPLDDVQINQRYGESTPQTLPIYQSLGQIGHNGYDLAANWGTPVYAADEGTVLFEGWGENDSWMGSPAGICIRIDHYGSIGGYAHLQDTVINKGDRVQKGQLIGHVGATGSATGAHLHFEMMPYAPNWSNGYAGRIDLWPYLDQNQVPAPVPVPIPEPIPEPTPEPVPEPIPEPIPEPPIIEPPKEEEMATTLTPEQLEKLNQTTKDVMAIQSAVTASPVVEEITASISKRTKVIVYLIGDTLLGLGAIAPQIVILLTTKDPFILATTLSATLATSGLFILTMFGIYKSK